MLEYDTKEVSKGVDVSKAGGSHESIICDQYFLDINFRFQVEVCSGCNYLMRKAMNFNDAAIVTVNRHDYRINFLFMSQMKPQIYQEMLI